MRITTLLIFTLALSLYVPAATSAGSQKSRQVTKLLEEAGAAFSRGEKESSKALFQQAAELGSRDAHFALAYKFVLPRELKVFHFALAAEQGHLEALKFALDALFFRAGDIRIGSPERALDIYRLALNVDPKLRVPYRNIDAIRKCIDPGTFDGAQFLKTHGLSQEHDDNRRVYYVWSLAEEAARGGRFGKPNPALVLHLVCRGGEVPAETEGAVKAVHAKWKEGKLPSFNLCDYVTSGMGMNYCSSRAKAAENEKLDLKLSPLIDKIGRSAEGALRNAYKAATGFYEKKAAHEEGHGGTGYLTWQINSVSNHQNEFLALVERVSEGFVPEVAVDFSTSDRHLNSAYQALLQQLNENPISGFNYAINADGVRAAQRLWVPYRDAFVQLLADVSPAVSEKTWLTWLTEVRTEQLRRVIR
ncbi:MAG: lysozyme inhibitor LprI family protein [Rhodospirillaceae bacterium]